MKRQSTRIEVRGDFATAFCKCGWWHTYCSFREPAKAAKNAKIGLQTHRRVKHGFLPCKIAVYQGGGLVLELTRSRWLTVRPICHPEAHWVIRLSAKPQIYSFHCSACGADHFSIQLGHNSDSSESNDREPHPRAKRRRPPKRKARRSGGGE